MECLAVAIAIADEGAVVVAVAGLGLLFFRGDDSEESCSFVTCDGGNGGTNARALDVPKALNKHVVL